MTIPRAAGRGRRRRCRARRSGRWSCRRGRSAGPRGERRGQHRRSAAARPGCRARRSRCGPTGPWVRYSTTNMIRQAPTTATASGLWPARIAGSTNISSTTKLSPSAASAASPRQRPSTSTAAANSPASHQQRRRRAGSRRPGRSPGRRRRRPTRPAPPGRRPRTAGCWARRGRAARDPARPAARRPCGRRARRTRCRRRRAAARRRPGRSPRRAGPWPPALGAHRRRRRPTRLLRRRSARPQHASSHRAAWSRRPGRAPGWRWTPARRRAAGRPEQDEPDQRGQCGGRQHAARSTFTRRPAGGAGVCAVPVPAARPCPAGRARRPWPCRLASVARLASRRARLRRVRPGSCPRSPARAVAGRARAGRSVPARRPARAVSSWPGGRPGRSAGRAARADGASAGPPPRLSLARTVASARRTGAPVLAASTPGPAGARSRRSGRRRQVLGDGPRRGAAGEARRPWSQPRAHVR